MNVYNVSFMSAFLRAIARLFDFRKKGKHLTRNFFDLLGGTAVLYLFVLYILWISDAPAGAYIGSFSGATLICLALWWKGFIRLTPIIDPDADECDGCGRLKPGCEKSETTEGGLWICRRCASGRVTMNPVGRLLCDGSLSEPACSKGSGPGIAVE